MSRPRPRIPLRRREALRLAMWKDQRGFCALCHAPVTLADSTIDHVLPVSLGGNDERWNLQLTHERCNIQKADSYPGR